MELSDTAKRRLKWAGGIFYVFVALLVLTLFMMAIWTGDGPRSSQEVETGVLVIFWTFIAVGIPCALIFIYWSEF